MAWIGNLFGGTGSTPGNEFVGQLVELGQQQLKIKRVIAEGGYGFVFVAQDMSSGKDYALKRLMAADEQTCKQIVKEVSFFRKLRGHPNIVQYVGAASGEKKANGMNEYLILTELCTGKLLDLLNSQGNQPLPYHQVLKIFAQVCRAVAHMHNQTPPIIHRDLKVENVLFSSKGIIKLCDFGSATTTALHPDDSWTALKRGMAEDEIQRNTTPMYRSPEMIDLYSNHAVTFKADVWALGCVLYMLCFKSHPFDDSAKLKIMNGNYTIPEFDRTFQDFHPLIHSMLKVNPEERPNVEDIYAELVSLATDKNIDLKAPVLETKVINTELEQTGVAAPQAAGSSVLLGNVVNKAGALFSNIKDVSSKMMHSVAGYTKSDLDISYITSRLLVMSFPADGIEATYKNNIDDVRVYLDSKHPDSYVVINISQRTYRTAKLNDRVYECGWNPKRAPSLDKLVSLCRKLNNFLKQHKKNVVVVHCLDGKTSSSILLSSFFMFCKLFSKVSMAHDLFNLKRSPVGQPIPLSPSQQRYIGYVCQLVASPRYIPHKNTVFLKSFTMAPIPIFNKARTGCRPFIEIYENDKRILSTAQEIEQMREYVVEDGKVVFQTHVRINGDITILVHHGRSTLGGKVQGKLTSINILALQFHTGFLLKQHNNFNFGMSELDIQEPNDKYSPNFGVNLNVKFTDEVPENAYTEPWEKMHVDKLSPYVCFASKEDYWQLYEEFGLSEEKTCLSKQMSTSSASDGECFTPRDNQNKTKGNSIFFNDLAWTSNNDAQLDTNLLEETTAPSNNHHVDDNFSSGINAEISNNLIDINPGPKFSNMDDLLGNMSPGSPVLSDSDLPKIDLIDPFESLAADRGLSPLSKSPEGDSNSNVLLNFDPVEMPTQDPLLPHPDLLNNTTAPLSKLSEPDVLPYDFTASAALKRNRSLDNLNEDFFPRFDEKSTDDTSMVTHKPKQPFDPFMKNFHDTPRKSSSESNLFGDWGDNIHTEALQPEKSTLHHSASSSSIKEYPATKMDPFAEFGNLSVGDNMGASKFSSNTRQQPVAPGLNQLNRSSPNQMMMNQGVRASPTPMANQSQLPQKSKMQQPRPKTSPNYNVFVTPSETGVFGKPSTGKSTNGWAPKPVSTNEFDDILNAQGFRPTTADGQKRTLKQLRAEENTENMDPIKRKIRDWADGKERNIRALITSLQTVLWESEDKWESVGMHQLIQPGQVKKFYRKACLCVHPDKHTGESHENLARAIFIELNEAWRLFEESGALG